jgi:DNA-binding transcriptional MerR regulator
MAGVEELLSIGRFARLSGLTVKALRHYAEIGLLRPAAVDDSTGYRYYALAQARDAEAIRRLRSLDVPLDEIRELLAADEPAFRERLAVHRAHLEGRVAETQWILVELDRLIDGKEQLVPDTKDVRIRFEVKIEEVPAQRYAVVRERVRNEQLPELIPRQIDAVHAYLQEVGARFVGPPICVCPFPDEEGLAWCEIGWPVEGHVEGRPPVEIKTYPASRALVFKHVGPYTELSRSYRLMSELMEENGLEPAGDPREIYDSDPEEVPDPNDYVTLIVWPIGAEGELSADADRLFERPAPQPTRRAN